MKNIYLLLTCLLAITCFSQTIAIQSFGTGFNSAVGIEHPANDSRLFIVQQGGLIRILNANGTVNATPFLNVSSIISTGSERGLLGLAFHPNYATNGLFFINYTNTAGNTVIARYSVSANPNVASTTGLILMTINQPYSNHNGGCLRFGPDGYLYIGMGDGGSGGDPQGYSQNLSLTNANVTANPSRIYLGKMLRIDVDVIAGLLNYGFPATNPYVNEAGKQEIWARGLRNPWKFTFNRLNGDLWIGDVGQDAVEEIDKVASPLPNTGLNFGWRCYEGNATYGSQTGCPALATLTQPVAQYTHAATGGCSITGGYVYTGTTYTNFLNKYFFADYCLNRLGYVNTVTNAITYTPNFTGSNFFTSFGEDLNGELYVTNGSVVFKIVDTTVLNNSEFEKDGFSLYPNPAKDTFTIKSSTNALGEKLELYDVSGKLLLSQSLNTTPENTISISNLSKGIYIVYVQVSNGNKYSSKLILE